MVMSLGEMCKQEGVDGLFRTIDRYKKDYGGSDPLFAFIGDGPDQKRMRSLAAEMDLSDVVHFAGRISDQDLWS